MPTTTGRGQPLGKLHRLGPQSKPIWFTELGIPAVDKGTNARRSGTGGFPTRRRRSPRRLHWRRPAPAAPRLAGGRYRLSNLLRGQRGSEHAMRNPVAAGARVLVLDLALSQPAISTDEVGLPLTWKIGPASRDIADPSYDTRTVTLTGRGRRRLSPVHVRGVRDATSGDVTLSWVRRTRIGGDSWEQSEVPLGEEAEAYELDVLDPSSAVLRTLSTLVSSVFYTAAQQTADFGSLTATFDVIVYQVSATYGRGIGTRTTINA